MTLGPDFRLPTYEGAGRAVALLVAVGAGLERRFGDNFSVSVGGAFVENESLQSFHGDIRLGYLWGAALAKGLIAPSN